MSKHTLSFGNLPPYDAFASAFMASCPDGRFRIRHGSSQQEWCVGAGDYTCRELYAECERLLKLDAPGGEEGPESWVSSILESIGIEWI